MNLTKNDIRLFELLDWEIDKSFSFGAYLTYEDGYYWQYAWKTERRTNVYYKNEDKLFIPPNQYFKASLKEVLWHYPTHADVLRYVQNKCYIDDWTISNQLYIETYGQYWEEELFLDLTKPIQNYSEEAKAELIEFLETIKK